MLNLDISNKVNAAKERLGICKKGNQELSSDVSYFKSNSETDLWSSSTEKREESKNSGNISELFSQLLKSEFDTEKCRIIDKVENEINSIKDSIKVNKHCKDLAFKWYFIPGNRRSKVAGFIVSNIDSSKQEYAKSANQACQWVFSLIASTDNLAPKERSVLIIDTLKKISPKDRDSAKNAFDQANETFKHFPENTFEERKYKTKVETAAINLYEPVRVQFLAR